MLNSRKHKKSILKYRKIYFQTWKILVFKVFTGLKKTFKTRKYFFQIHDTLNFKTTLCTGIKNFILSVNILMANMEIKRVEVKLGRP
jgi:hypothetical protein